jgi:ATP-dependent RNA helicase DDX18/HAS1
MTNKKKILTYFNYLKKSLINKSSWMESLKKNHFLTQHTFENLLLSKQTIISLVEQFFTHMTKIQNLTIPFQVCGFDILGSARTGSGKTIAFLLPTIEFFFAIKWNFENGTAALIITPTRELSLQNYYVLKDLLKYHTHTHGIVTGGSNKKTEIEKLKKKPFILVGTPGRLLDHLKTTKYLKMTNLQFFIIDEADKCLEIGFEEEMLEITNLLPKNRQTILFSATQTKNVQNLAKISFRKNPIFLGNNELNKEEENNQGIEQGFVVCNLEDKLVLLLALLKKNSNKSETRKVSQIIDFLNILQNRLII